MVEVLFAAATWSPMPQNDASNSGQDCLATCYQCLDLTNVASGRLIGNLMFCHLGASLEFTEEPILEVPLPYSAIFAILHAILSRVRLTEWFRIIGWAVDRILEEAVRISALIYRGGTRFEGSKRNGSEF